MTSAEKQLEVLFAKYVPAIAKLGRALRKKLRARLPGLTEIVYFYEGQCSLVISYSPTENGYEGVCTLALYPEEVKLFLSGGPLLSKSDTNKLLKGSGKTVRYVPMNSASDLDRPEIEALIAAALDLAKVRPVAGAIGPVVMKADDQKKRAARTKSKASASSSEMTKTRTKR